MTHLHTARPLSRFLPIVIGLVVLPIAGMAGYCWLEGWPLLDALYMTVTTLSTVGYGEIHPLSRAGRVFTMGLIAGGGLFAAYSLSSLAQFFFSGEWHRHLEEKKRIRMLTHLSNHIIVCGYGRVGRNVAAELKLEVIPFVIIDLNPEKIAQAQKEGYLAVLGDASHESKLQEAGIERARGLVAAAKSDAENVFIVLTARSMRPDLSIVARADYEESEPKLLRAGASRVILPYHITGRRMVTMLVRPDVGDFLDEVSHTGGMELLLEQVQVSAKSPLVGQRLADSQVRHQFDITLLACKGADGQWNTRPRSDTLFQAGSQVIALGTLDHLQKLIEVARR